MSMISLSDAALEQDEGRKSKRKRGPRSRNKNKGTSKNADKALPKKKLYGDARDREDYEGPRSTMPPRQREGKPYAGGRTMRRQLAKLGREQNAYVPVSKPADHKRHMPGSMTL